MGKTAVKYAMAIRLTIYICAFAVSLDTYLKHAVRGSKDGDRGFGPPPLKNHKNTGFLSITGPDPLKITKLPNQHSILGHHRHASETPFKWRFAGGPMISRL